MKKDDEKAKNKKRKIQFLTGPEVDMLRAFGQNWESVIEDCYKKIYQFIENDEQVGPTFKYETIQQRNAVKGYFLDKKFKTYCSISGLSVQILF